MMQWISLSMKVLLLCLGMAMPLYSDTPHLASTKQAVGLTLQYSLVDLGECDLDAKALTRLHDGLSLGPLINNHGDIIGNRSSGGFVKVNFAGEYTPKIEGAKLNFHSINNHKDILVSITRDPKSVEWFVWPTAEEWNNRRLRIDPVELEGYKIALSKLNDLQQVAGVAKPEEQSLPVDWSRDKGLYRIANNENLIGIVKDLNQQGAVVGKSHRQLEAFPFLAFQNRLTSLFPLRRHFKLPSDGKIIFKDLVISQDNSVFGTYWIDRDFDNPSARPKKAFLAFKWVPSENSLALLDLEGMRISGINNRNRMVGSLHGKACFRDENYKPISLASSIDRKETKGWKFFEATGINDKGQIVGFGKKGGKTHLFLANPL